MPPLPLTPTSADALLFDLGRVVIDIDFNRALALSQMDFPTRSSYVMAVVTPAEGTAAASRRRGASYRQSVPPFPASCWAGPALPLVVRVFEDRLWSGAAADVPAYKAAEGGLG